MRLWKLSLVFLSLTVLLLFISCVQSANGERTALAGLAISKGCYDADNDGYGKAGNSISACKNSRKVFDCDDTNSNVNPAAREICANKIDDNCNRKVDEAGCLTLPRPIPLPTAEVCDGRDNDEDGQTDEGCNLCIDYDPANNPTEGGSINVTRNGEVLPLTWSQGNFALPFVDSCYIHGADANGGTSINESTCDNTYRDYPYPASTIVACPSGTVCIDPDGISGTTAAYCGTICVPSEEICDAIDNNCDGRIDEGCDICTDSDPANNPTERGTLTITGANGEVLTPVDQRAFSDSCFIYGVDANGGTSINESTCEIVGVTPTDPSRTFYAGTIVTCPSGTLCTDPDGVFGATPASCSPCTDSDSTDPRNPTASYTTAGSVSTSAGTFADRCDPEGTDLFENYCDAGVRYEQDFSCNALGADYRCFTNSQGRAYCGR